MKRLFSGIIIFFLALSSGSALAQSISAQVSSKRVQVGVPFEFAVVISGQATNYNQPQFRDFDVVSGPNQSSSIQYVNGVLNQQMVFSYALVAKKEGKLTIGIANAIVNGQKLETQAITIEASKNPNAGQQQEESSKRSNVNDLFIKTTLSKSKCYVGEQITIIQKVYCRNQIVGYQKSPQQSYDGFYCQAQESPTRGQLIPENLDGVNYYTHEVMRTTATANKAGKIILSPIEAEVVIRRQATNRPRNWMEQLLGGGGYEDVPMPVKSRPTVIEVLPLPEQGKPENFTGGVGVFTSKVEASRTELKANEAINLRVIISGRGNLKFIEPPKLDLPESFETYDPKVTESPNSKVFEFLIIPRHEGQYDLKGLDFSFFNLDSKKYITEEHPPLKISVSPGEAGSEGAQVFTPHSQVKETENDIRYIKKGNFVLNKSEFEFFNSFWHFFYLILIIVLLGLVLFVRRTHLRNNSDQVLVRQRKAAGLARKRMVTAEKMMQAGKKDEFYTEVLNSINNYLSFRLNIPVADLSKETILKVMNDRNVEASVIEKLVNTLQTSEYAKYAPGAVSGDLQQVYNDTIGLVTEIENQLSKKVA
jgi:hypothetical protein